MDSPATPRNAISKVPQNFVRCPVCLAQYDINRALRKPIMLECHHSACRTCVASLINRVPRRTASAEDNLMANPRVLNCPICRARTRIPLNGMNGLQENFYIVAVLENLQNQNSTPIRMSDNLGESSGGSSLKMWCESCSKVATTDCESHSVKQVSEAILVLEGTLNRNLERAKDNLVAQEEMCTERISSTDLRARMEMLQNCLDRLTSNIRNRIVYLQETADRKQDLEMTLCRLRRELQEIETRRDSTDALSDETGQFVSRTYLGKINYLQKISDMLRRTDDIILKLRLVTPPPEERRQSSSEQYDQVVDDVTIAFDM